MRLEEARTVSAKKQAPLPSWFVGSGFPLRAETSTARAPPRPSNETREGLNCSKHFVIALKACSNPYFKIFKGHLANVCESELMFCRSQKSLSTKSGQGGEYNIQGPNVGALPPVPPRAPAGPQAQGRRPRRHLGQLALGPRVWALLGGEVLGLVGSAQLPGNATAAESEPPPVTGGCLSQPRCRLDSDGWQLQKELLETQISAISTFSMWLTNCF